jgi:hypothetical protein
MARQDSVILPALGMVAPFSACYFVSIRPCKSMIAKDTCFCYSPVLQGGSDNQYNARSAL